jgi:hypothetical protein
MTTLSQWTVRQQLEHLLPYLDAVLQQQSLCVLRIRPDDCATLEHLVSQYAYVYAALESHLGKSWPIYNPLKESKTSIGVVASVPQLFEQFSQNPMYMKNMKGGMLPHIDALSDATYSPQGMEVTQTERVSPIHYLVSADINPLAVQGGGSIYVPVHKLYTAMCAMLSPKEIEEFFDPRFLTLRNRDGDILSSPLFYTNPFTHKVQTGFTDVGLLQVKNPKTFGVFTQELQNTAYALRPPAFMPGIMTITVIDNNLMWHGRQAIEQSPSIVDLKNEKTVHPLHIQGLPPNQTIAELLHRQQSQGGRLFLRSWLGVNPCALHPLETLRDLGAFAPPTQEAMVEETHNLIMVAHTMGVQGR